VLQIRARGENDVRLAVAGQVGRGRLLAVADSSVVINQMLRYPGNRELAIGIARYLVDDDTWGSRGGKVYVVANEVREQGAFGNRSSFAKSLGAAVRDASTLISTVHQQGLPTSLLLALGGLAALVTLSWVASTAARAYRRQPPRFARPVPLVSQGGVAGRAAVLAAPTTHRALALLELKSALEEAIAVRFGLDLPLAPAALLEAVDRSSALDDDLAKALRKLVLTMGTVETSVAAGHPIRIRDRDVKAASGLVQRVIEAVDSARAPNNPPTRGS
jgi:hypothetical protein